MSAAWGDAGLLIELVDRQFEYLLALKGSMQLLQIRPLMAFLRRDSRTAALLQDFRREAQHAKALFAKADQRMRRRLASIWHEHSAQLLSALAPSASQFRPPYDDLAGYQRTLKRRVAVTLPDKSDTAREAEMKMILLTLKFWLARVPVDDEHARGECQGRCRMRVHAAMLDRAMFA